MKRKQRVRRPLGEMPPLSDRAPRDIKMREGRASTEDAKAISGSKQGTPASPGSESIACGYS